VSNIERVLIRLPNWLGDALLARPLLHALRRALPGAELSGVAPAVLLELLGADARLDRRDPWPAERGSQNRLVAELRHWRAAAALVLPPSFSSAYFAWRVRAPLRIGYRGDGRRALLTRALPRPPRGELHLSDEYLALGAPLGARAVPLPTLDLPPRAHSSAEALLERFRVAGTSNGVLGPGAIYGPAKRWGARRFASLGRRLLAHGYAVLVCGAVEEREICEAVARDIGTGAVSLAGHTSLLAQTALCARAAVVVCNDSGLAHLSAAVGAPTVVLFGSTSSAWTAPLGPRVRVVQHAPVCSPCFRRTCRVGYTCLRAIEVGEVERACREIAA